MYGMSGGGSQKELSWPQLLPYASLYYSTDYYCIYQSLLKLRRLHISEQMLLSSFSLMLTLDNILLDKMAFLRRSSVTP